MLSYWMLWRDRRATVTAAAIFAGYLALLLMLALGIAGATPVFVTSSKTIQAAFSLLITCNLGLLLWRLGMRGAFTGRCYGWRQGVWAVLRQPVSNIILVMTARRALRDHWRGLKGQPLVWDKTDHVFPGAILARRPVEDPHQNLIAMPIIRA